MPLKNSLELEESRSIALKCLYSSEGRLAKHTVLNRKCLDFMKEYLDLEYIIEKSGINEKNRYYIPHHAIVKQHERLELFLMLLKNLQMVIR